MCIHVYLFVCVCLCVYVYAHAGTWSLILQWCSEPLVFSFANSLEKLYNAHMHVCARVCITVKHLKCIDMQQRMGNTMYQFYFICVEAPFSQLLLRNLLCCM